MDDLSTEPPDIAETQALDDLAAGRHETDRVFHELRDVAPPAPLEVVDDRTAGDDPEDTLPPAATAAFTFDAVTDDLLPSWNLGLG